MIVTLSADICSVSKSIRSCGFTFFQSVGWVHIFVFCACKDVLCVFISLSAFVHICPVQKKTLISIQLVFYLLSESIFMHGEMSFSPLCFWTELNWTSSKQKTRPDREEQKNSKLFCVGINSVCRNYSNMISRVALACLGSNYFIVCLFVWEAILLCGDQRQW